MLAYLKGHKDLGIHSEMFSDGVVDLVEAGCVTNTHKAYHPGKIVGSFLVGTRKLFDFVDNNPFVGERREGGKAGNAGSTVIVGRKVEGRLG